MYAYLVFMISIVLIPLSVLNPEMSIVLKIREFRFTCAYIFHSIKVKLTIKKPCLSATTAAGWAETWLLSFILLTALAYFCLFSYILFKTYEKPILFYNYTRDTYIYLYVKNYNGYIRQIQGVYKRLNASMFSIEWL